MSKSKNLIDVKYEQLPQKTKIISEIAVKIFQNI